MYEQVAPVRPDSPPGGGMLQRGLIGALGLVPYRAGIVQPHEDVAPGPVAGRRQLMEATQANLEPIFLLYQGGNGAATELVDEVADDRPPLAEACTARRACGTGCGPSPIQASWRRSPRTWRRGPR